MSQPIFPASSGIGLTLTAEDLVHRSYFAVLFPRGQLGKEDLGSEALAVQMTSREQDTSCGGHDNAVRVLVPGQGCGHQICGRKHVPANSLSLVKECSLN